MCSELFDMAPGDLTGGGASRKGLRDTGRPEGGIAGGEYAGGSSKGEVEAGGAKPVSTLAGEAARLRNGLLEERMLRCDPAAPADSCPIYEGIALAWERTHADEQPSESAR